MSVLTEEQTNFVIEKLGQLYNLSDLFSEDAANRIVSKVKEFTEWENAIKQQLTSAGLPQTLDQIPQLSIQNLTPIFSLYNLDASKESLTTLLDKISSSKDLEDAVAKKLAELGLSVNSINIDRLSLTSDDYILEEVKSLRPEYLTGTWFNTQGRPFKLSLELDWINLMYHGGRIAPSGDMSIWLYESKGENIWDFISEIYVHPTATVEFSLPRDGWIEFPAYTDWKYLAYDSPLSFIERNIKTNGGRTIVLLKGAVGGWATFERVTNPMVTEAAARLLSRFSDPLYCARSDGKVVIKFQDLAYRGALLDNASFPSGRTLVDSQNKFPF